MASEVKIKIAIDDDGTLSLIGAKAKQAGEKLDDVGKSTDKLGKKRGNYNKLEKGAAQITSNSTKAFAKQAQTIGGGLVPAYAILASNVFALSAAFNFFKQAADVQLLEQSQVAFATNTGVALSSITQRLRDASGAMLGFREAGEAAAIGLAKGFSPSQLEALAEGARKASTALGRGFQDSFDRLIRGASKAEPELLDELGITLRLEEATQRYADSIGRNRDELNAYQRSQAVLIETQRQLNKNFGEVESATNPFVRLLKTFEDIVKAATQFLLPAFEGLANILNRSAGAAIAAFGLLALSIFKSIAPMDIVQQKLDGIRENAASNLEDATKNFDKYKEKIIETGKTLEETRKQGALGAQQALSGYKGDSATLKKLKAGTPVGKGDLQQLDKMLTAAERQIEQSGKITTGKLKGFNATQLKDLRQNYQKMSATRVTFVGRTVDSFKRIELSARKTFASMKKRGTSAFLGLATVAQKAGGLMDKALSLAGFVGIIILLKDMVGVLIDSPFTIALGFAKMADTIVNLVSRMINFVSRPFLGMVDGFIDAFSSVRPAMAKIANGIVKLFLTMIDGVMNTLSTVSNAVIDVVNKFRDDDNQIQLIDNSNLRNTIQIFDETAPAASNLAGAYQDLNTESSKYETLLRNSDAGAFAYAKQEEARYTKQSADALAEYNKVLIKSAEATRSTIQGIEDQEDPIKKARMAFENLRSVDVPGLYNKIFQEQTRQVTALDGSKKMITEYVMSEKDREKALADLKVTLEAVGKISPQMGEALAAATLESAEGLKSMGKQVVDTAVQMAFFEESIGTASTKIKDDLASGSIGKAIEFLEQMGQAARDSGKNIDDLTGTSGNLEAFQERFEQLFGKDSELTASGVLVTLKGIKETTDALILSNAGLVGMSSKNKTIIEEQLKTLENQNKITLINLQLQQQITAEKRRELQLAKDLLNIEQRMIEVKQRRRVIDRVGGAAGVGSTGKLALQNAADIRQANAVIEASEKAKVEIFLKAFEANRAMTASEEARIASLDGVIESTKAGVAAIQETAISDTFSALAEDFAKLGPEGEVLSSLSAGMATVVDVANMAKDGFEGTAEKAAAAAAMIGAVASIASASSAQRVAAIDAEIKAEKDRDGKSAQSVAKIQQLEKKKEAVQRKAFNVNKKLMMAQTIASTAAGMAGAMAIKTPYEFPIGLVAAGIVAAMGAVALATIAGTSFQGGGSAPSAPGPSSISVGDRRSSIDISKSRGGAGELAYLRGGQGVGGPENFQPAFTGYKNRNYGGRTGFMVGEQGPELFVPERQGSIIPADDTEQLMGGGSNVTFNINTIDASGVEDVLVAQQGNIIGMLRTAANSYGQDFFESVDESVYTTPAVGRA
ncbi:MAG: hypothetical protein CBD88_07850 [Flavobacteriales bacterium TMED228]|nr:MAG: hypothetical protein CBD88_07850 [Flavobacteriales bacterium TMED228]